MAKEREPLVNFRTSNAWPKSSHRRSLPAGGWGGRKDSMDVGDPRKTAVLEVKPKTNYYLDVEDNRSK